MEIWILNLDGFPKTELNWGKINEMRIKPNKKDGTRMKIEMKTK